MQIVLASSEAVPFSKTGGLADVASGLAKALASLGHTVTLIVPYHRRQAPSAPPISETGVLLQVPIRARTVTARVCESSLSPNGLRVLLIDQPEYFDRAALYSYNGRDYDDNCERFVFFSRAVIEAIAAFHLEPDVVHANDWQTGLIPALLKLECSDRPGFERTASVMTIHNLAFQGRFWKWDMPLTGLDWSHFNWREFEYHGDLNLMKAGLVFADMLTTVSPTYANEICTPQFGCGLEGVLVERRDRLVGILNGIDTEEWNPAVDPYIARNYSPGDWSDGKRTCKRNLQSRLNLDVRDDALLFGMVSRFTSQKGLGLIESTADDLLQLNVQFAFLGSGDARFEQLVREMSHRAPDRVAGVLEYNEPLAHQIEAGADAFLMPSLFEPCGLNQQYSLVYGTVPLVHAVGGLADSVRNGSGDGPPNGFRFGPIDTSDETEFVRKASGEFLGEVRRAVDSFHDPAVWKSLVETGMSEDRSWRTGAEQYVDVYRLAQAQS